MNLPEGLTARPLEISDAEAVAAVVRAEETADVGTPETTVADIQGDWQRPTYDLSTSTLGVYDGDALVAYAEVVADAEVYTSVHPDHRGRGIGTALAAWARETARAKGYARVASQVPVGGPADRLMTDLGYEERWTAGTSSCPRVRASPASRCRTGTSSGTLTEDDQPTVYDLIEDAFVEWSDRERHTVEDFGSRVLGPARLRAVEPARRVRPRPVSLVGATHVHPRTATSATSPGSRSAATGAGWAWPGRCSSTRSAWRGSTAPSAATSPPTRGPGHSVCTRRSAW